MRREGILDSIPTAAKKYYLYFSDNQDSKEVLNWGVLGAVEGLLRQRLTQPHVVIGNGKIYVFAFEGNWCADL